MLIVILGNIASGKTTLAKKLHNKIGHQLLSIDAYRKRHNRSHTEVGDRLAIEHIIKHLTKGGDFIMEMTGTGKHYERILSYYSGHTLKIMLSTDVDQCKRNHQRRLKRGYKLPPMWYDQDINKSIEKVAMLLPMVDYDILMPYNPAIDDLVDQVSIFG